MTSILLSVNRDDSAAIYTQRTQNICITFLSRHNVPKSKYSLQFDTPADDVVAVSACINQLLTLRNNVHLGNIPQEDIISGIDLHRVIFSMFIHIITL